jgi:integrase
MLFRNKVDIKTISTLLGHASVQITIDTYIHFAEAEGYLAVDSLKNNL